VIAFNILSTLMLRTCGTKGACHDSQTGPTDASLGLA